MGPALLSLMVVMLRLSWRPGSSDARHDGVVSSRIRVAYTLEQLWHRVPGGTAVAALRVAEALLRRGDIDLIGVAGRHSGPPDPAWSAPVPVRPLRVGPPLLYDAWLRIGRPRVESVVDQVDVVHSTTLIPAATRRPHVVTLHDLAWRHDPGQFTPRGVSVFDRSLRQIIRRADLVLCASRATIGDAIAAGIPEERLRLVPLGVDPTPVGVGEIERVRQAHALPADYLLFVGTVEPRKNLGRLVRAVALVPDAPPLVVAGAPGWGDVTDVDGADVRFLGFVSDADKTALYAGAAALCYPSEREGFGLPVLEAMAQGAPVVTSRGTSTEEVAGGAGVLVDPFDVDDIARGIIDALERRDELSTAGRAHAATCSWDTAAALTVAAYEELA
jgi:glycosyltransferase involved in cell wall biosynthesis